MIFLLKRKKYINNAVLLVCASQKRGLSREKKGERVEWRKEEGKESNPPQIASCLGETLVENAIASDQRGVG